MATKLPPSLKVGIYANLISASADLILAGSNSSAKLSAWSAEGGASVIDTPFLEGLPFRAAPQFNGVAVLPGGRFVQASNEVNFDQKFPGTLAVFAADGSLVGKLHEGSFGPCAASADGALVAVVGPDGVALWKTDDLIAGGKPFRQVSGLTPRALAFTLDSASIVALVGRRLLVTPVKSGAPAETGIEARLSDAELVSVSESGLVCVSDQSSAVLLNLAGKKLCEWNVHGEQFPVEHAMVTREGQVIAAAGDLGKHYDLKYYGDVKFPEKEMAQGFVAVHDGKGKLLDWKPRAKNKPVRAMGLSPGRAVVLGQDSFAELLPWPL